MRNTTIRALHCAADRAVDVYQVVEGTAGLFATTTTSKVKRSYVWSVEGAEAGARYNAEVEAQPGCRGDVSRTTEVRRGRRGPTSTGITAVVGRAATRWRDRPSPSPGNGLDR